MIYLPCCYHQRMGETPNGYRIELILYLLAFGSKFWMNIRVEQTQN